MEGWRREREAERRNSPGRQIRQKYFHVLLPSPFAVVAAIPTPQPQQRKLKTRPAEKVRTRNRLAQVEFEASRRREPRECAPKQLPQLPAFPSSRPPRAQ